MITEADVLSYIRTKIVETRERTGKPINHISFTYTLDDQFDFANVFIVGDNRLVGGGKNLAEAVNSIRQLAPDPEAIVAANAAQLSGFGGVADAFTQISKGGVS